MQIITHGTATNTTNNAVSD